MKRRRFRDANNNWRGGRVVASNGYVLVRVGTGHHLADVRGYAYEHRIEVERKLGRRLSAGEVVHHIDGNRGNNAHENLKVCASTLHHHAHHRKQPSKLRDPDEVNPIVTCECGCGTTFRKFDDACRPRRFISGHNASRGSNGRFARGGYG